MPPASEWTWYQLWTNVKLRPCPLHHRLGSSLQHPTGLQLLDSTDNRDTHAKSCNFKQVVSNCAVSTVSHRRQRVKMVAMVAPATQQLAENSGEAALVEALIGVQGRGRSASTRQLQDVAEAVTALEAGGGVSDPASITIPDTGSPLIEGRWQLMYTTRPGTASPIQRTFVGVDAFSVFQEILRRGTDDPRVNNIVRFSEEIGELKVEAAASVSSGERTLFRFDKAAFSLKFLPSKCHVLFLSNYWEAKPMVGSIQPTCRRKGTSGYQEAIRRLMNLSEAIQQRLLRIYQSLLESGAFYGAQTSDANWLLKATSNIPNWQIVKSDTRRFENLVRFLPGVRLRARARSEAISETRRSVNIEGADLELGPLKIPLKISAQGYTDIL